MTQDEIQKLVDLFNETTLRANNEIALIGQQVVLKTEEIKALVGRAQLLSASVDNVSKHIDYLTERYYSVKLVAEDKL